MTDRIKILFIEDDDHMCEIVRSLLQQAQNGFELECCPTLKGGMLRLSDGGVDCVLLDLGLPDSQGMASLTALLTHFPWMPAIVVSGTDSIDTAEACVKAGAQDYLAKKRMPADLAWSVRLALARHQARIGGSVSDKLDRTIERLRQRIQGAPALPMMEEQA